MKITTKIILLIITVISIVFTVGAIYFYNPALDLDNQAYDLQNTPLADVRAQLVLGSQDSFANILMANPEFQQYVVDEILLSLDIQNIAELNDKISKYEEFMSLSVDGQLSAAEIYDLVDVRVNELLVANNSIVEKAILDKAEVIVQDIVNQKSEVIAQDIVNQKAEEIKNEIYDNLAIIVSEFEESTEEKIKEAVDAELDILTQTIEDGIEGRIQTVVEEQVADINLDEVYDAIDNTIEYQMIEKEDEIIKYIDNEVSSLIDEIDVCDCSEETVNVSDEVVPVDEAGAFEAPVVKQTNTFSIDEYKKVREANKKNLLDLVNNK